MNVYFPLIVIALITAFLSAGLYLAEKKTVFGSWKPRLRQVLYGVIFGVLAICGTEFGANVGGITMNESTAAPLCAGLIFGAPAGVISGLIGGVERYFATYWGAGYYGRYAGSLAIIFAGFSGAAMRRFMFDDKKPAWYYGLAAGIISEVVDMLLLLLTRMNDVREAFYTVELGTFPLALMNGLAVMLALMLVSFIGKARKESGSESGREGLAQTFQKWLLACVTLAFLATSIFTFWVEDGISDSQIENTLKLNITDVSRDILDASDENLLKVTREAAVLLQMTAKDISRVNSETLRRIRRYLHVAELDLVNDQGILTATTLEGAEGYDMASQEQSAAFLRLLEGEQEMVQSYQPTGFDPSISRKYAGIALEGGGFLQVGYDAVQFQRDIADQAADATNNRHVGENGFIVICDENWQIVSDSSGHTGQDMRDLNTTGYWLDTESMPDFQAFRTDIYGVPSRCMYMQTEGYIIMGVIPESEAVFTRNVSVYISIFMEVIIFTLLFVLIYILIKHLIVDNIHRINRSLGQITEGNLEVKVNVRSNEEFASLSDDINTTVDVLKRYIDEAAARIDKELALAKAIQSSALPSVFPPYPNRTEFDIWAGMRTAKEVGGDFYDFYMLGEDKLVFLIADVSGKGIPAAMFMMTAKTLIKSLAETGMPVEQVLTEANEQLCANNSAGMFVTAWMGILDLETGIVSFGNAGHNPPLLCRAGSTYEYLKSRPGLVLAGMEGIRYRRNEIRLEPGDVLYLYTDGVTEATDQMEELYGEERLNRYLNGVYSCEPETICRAVLEDVDRFVGNASQFDDITMLCLRYRGHGQEITVEAVTDNVKEVTEFVESQLEKAECPFKVIMQINVAIDEIFSNIARYAYGDKPGEATVRVEINEKIPSATLIFMDKGSPFNPLEREDPDVTLSAGEREIGGLGIFLVKKTMDQMEYEYRNGMNRLKIVKKW